MLHKLFEVPHNLAYLVLMYLLSTTITDSKVSPFDEIEGWRFNHTRVERIWRQEGLKVPKKQPKRGRLWLTDGSYIRLRPEKKDHVWSYDMAMIRIADGRALRILVIIDEFTRECLSIYVAHGIRSQDVVDQLYNLFINLGTLEQIRSDNAPGIHSEISKKWFLNLGVATSIHRAWQSVGE